MRAEGLVERDKDIAGIVISMVRGKDKYSKMKMTKIMAGILASKMNPEILL